MPPDRNAALRAAVGCLTGWRTRSTDTVTGCVVLSAAIADIGYDDLLSAEVELADGILRGAELMIDRILADRVLLRKALVLAALGVPLRASDLAADAGSILTRAGMILAVQEDT